jgi:hypothetical protein
MKAFVLCFFRSSSSSSVGLRSVKDLGHLTHGRCRNLFRHSIGPFGWVISRLQRPVPTQDNTTQHRNTRTNIHALSGIRTGDLGVQMIQDLRLRPRGHWDRQFSSSDALFFGEPHTCLPALTLKHTQTACFPLNQPDLQNCNFQLACLIRLVTHTINDVC